ncbi:DnaJ domain-containing protein [Botrimarina sp.]|uniref:DnaJ domain-containing protein n=1 Tax=Botrimarina sp. TaxID=2795802 RepID=UPI0032EECD17
MDVPSPEKSSRGHSNRRHPQAVDKLGLALPVTEADVKQAYFRKAQKAHPDHGGNAEEFREVQEAFEEALQFAKRNGKRLPWIGAQIEQYVAQTNAVELVESLGGRAYVERLDWLNETIGDDFAQLADRLKSIDLALSAATDADLARVLGKPSDLPYLETLNLRDTAVTDQLAERLHRLPSLRIVDLRGTRFSQRERRRLAKKPGVERVEGLSRWGGWFGG